MAWEYKLKKNSKKNYIEYHKYNIPTRATNIRKVDARKKKYSNLKQTKNGYEVLK